MITCDAVSFVSIGSVAVSLLFGTLWLPHLLVVAFLEGSAQIFYRLSERAAVRNVVEPEHLPAALSQNEARSRAAGLLGQPLGSALFALVRWAPFVFTALGHLVALLTLLLIRKEFQTSREGGRRDVRAEIAEGVRWLLGQRFLRSAVLLVGCTNVLFQVLSLSLAVTIRDSGGSPAVIGVIGAASGVGGVLGAMSGSWFVRRLCPGMVIIVVFAVWAAFMPLVALTTNPVLLGAVFAGMSCAGALINVMAGVYQVQVTPDAMQGRVGAVAGLLSSGANSFGALAAGFLLASLTVGSTVLGVSAVMAALAVTAGLSPVIRTMPGMTCVRDVMAAVRAQRTMPREGRTAGGVAYSVQGAGCRMSDEDGRVVDVDLVSDPHTGTPVEAFDVWRIGIFLSAGGSGPFTNDELTAACEQLAGNGELRVVERGRWFALPASG